MCLGRVGMSGEGGSRTCRLAFSSLISEMEGPVVSWVASSSFAQCISGRRNSISKIDFRLAASAQRYET